MNSLLGSDLVSVIFYSTAQSLLSSFLILALGALAAFGLAPIQGSRKKRAMELILIAPSVLPALLVLVSAFNLVTVFGPFPLGLVGVVIVHVLVNVGLITVTISRLIEQKLSGVIELATIEGAKRFRLVWLALRELSNQLRNIFVFLFIVCFTSFSIPMIVGAKTGRTIESLIYETLQDHSKFKMAFWLSTVQLIFILGFSFFNRTFVAFSKSAHTEFHYLSRISLKPFLILIFVLTGLLLFGLFSGVPRGWSDVVSNTNLLVRLANAARGTFAEATIVGVIIALLATLVAYFSPNVVLNRFLLGFSVPSAAILGFLLVSFFDLTTWIDSSVVTLISLGFAIVLFATLYRLRLSDAFREITGEIEVARVFGATRWLRFSKLIWPMVKDDIVYISGLAALWASCDFAFASILAGHDITLGVAADHLLSGYRSEAATIISLFAFAIGALVYLAFHLLLVTEKFFRKGVVHDH